MPSSTHKTELQEFFDYGIDVKNRRIYLFEEIEEEKTDKVILGLHYLESIKEAPIEVYINSPGGLVSVAFGIYDAIRNASCEIHTIGTGEICSAATVILVSGDKRYATEHSMFMMHQAKFYNNDLSEVDHLSRVEADKKIIDMWYRLLGKHTKKTAAEWKKLTRSKGEVWLDAKQMKDWKVIDEIIKEEE